MSKWHRFEILPKSAGFTLPAKPCVYVVYFDDHPVYVGQTNRLSNRFNEHKFRFGYGNEIITPWGDIHKRTRISLKAKFSERYGDWAMWEIRLIRKMQPKFNTHHKKLRG